MSCEVRLLARCANIAKWKQYLFCKEISDTTWLHKCFTTISPTGDIVVLAYGSAIVILKTQWDKSGQEAEPRLAVFKQWDGDTALSIKDEVSSVAILPVVTAGQSNGVDWICIAVGFKSGYLRFYTESMDLLAESLLHPEPIFGIKASSHRIRKEHSADGGDSSEALYVIYPSVTCYFRGFSLFQTLRSSRREVAMQVAQSQRPKLEATFEYKKYAFSQYPVEDACFLGCSTVNNFDHLLAVSISEGFYSNYRPSPPQHLVIASTGQNAWLQLEHTMDGMIAPMGPTDLVVDTITNWWTGRSGNKKTESAMKTAEKLGEMSRLTDRQRKGRCVVPSPDGSLIAVTDSLGRVALIDIRTNVAIRLWKGCRDAECGFLEVEEDLKKSRRRRTGTSASSSSESPRMVTLLVIYTPKKGLIELYPLRHGPCIAALKVSKNGRLIYNFHDILGYSTAPRKKLDNLLKIAFFCEDGLLDLNVPFHCALVDASSRTKDLLILKQLGKVSNRNEDELIEEVLSLVKKLETDEVRLKALELVMSFKFITPRVAMAVIELFLEVAKGDDLDGTVDGSKNVIVICKNLRRLVRFFEYVSSCSGEPEDCAVAGAESSVSLAEALLISEEEASLLLDFLNNAEKASVPKRDGKVSFRENAKHSLAFFLQCLDYTDSGPVLAVPNLSEEKYSNLGELLYSAVSENLGILLSWESEVALSSLSPSVLARALLSYWLQLPSNDFSKSLIALKELLAAVSSLCEEPVASGDSNTESPWWTELRGILAGSGKTIGALTAAVCCRAVSLISEQQVELLRGGQEKDGGGENTDKSWENVSADTWQWDLLISQLEDVALLNSILSVRPVGHRGSCHEEVSLNSLVTKGEGAASELTAKWLCQFRIQPLLLIEKGDTEFLKSPIEPESFPKGKKILKGDEALSLPLIEVAEEVQPGSPQEASILGYFRLLKKRFPYSLTSSAILGHMGWEFLCQWQSNLADLSLLTSAVQYFKSIPSATLKTGICSLAWSTHIKLPFKSLVDLVRKVGKLPTDTLCSRELSLARSDIPVLLKAAETLLEAIIEASCERPQTAFVPRREAIWRGGVESAGLVSVALSRPPPVEDCLSRTHQISVVLHMVAVLELKDKTFLVPLLDSLPNDLSSSVQVKSFVHTTKEALVFLCRAVSAVVQTVCLVEGEDGVARFDAKAATRWMRTCSNLASSWNLSLDFLQRHYICELYSCGYDRLAEENLPMVSETETLASQLLVILGHRIKAVINSSPEPQHIMADLSTSVTTWINSLGDDGIKETQSSIEDSLLLLARILQWLPENHKDLRLAYAIDECLSSLQKS